MRQPSSPKKAAEVRPAGAAFTDNAEHTGESMKRFFAVAIVAAMAMPLLAADGAAVFKAKCAGCHGADGSKSIPAMGVKPLNTAEVKGKSEAQLVDIITKGQGKMKPQAVSADEAKAAAAYVKSLK
jgi:mono/diheme cytochrome c family protein